MRLTILHLSDIHVSDTSDLPRPESIAAVLREAEQTPDHVLVLVTGDVAFSAGKTQYARASTFLQCVSEQVERVTNSKPSFVAVPGNHDCAFPSDSSVRDLVLDRVRTSGGECETDGYLRTCVEVQDEFFRWAESNKLVTPTTDRHRFAWVSEVRVKDAKTVAIMACNTAWMSSLHEQQGHLRFPVAHIPTPPPADVVLAALHHPYNWFEASNARSVMRTLEGTADVILTGHEHEGTAFAKRTNEGATVNYVEGEVLSDTSGAISGFNVVNVDLVANQYQTKVYRWDGERYATAAGDSQWVPFVRNARRASAAVELTDEMERFLCDPGAQLTHRAKELRLEDVFVPPNLRRFVRIQGEEGLHREVTDSDFVINRVFESKRVHLSGPTQCGKTALAKMLFRQAIQRQLTPLHIRGGKVDHADPRHLNRLVETEIKRQYKRPAFDAFMQLPKEAKVVIIDDFVDSPLNRQAKGAVCAWLAERFDFIVIFGGELTQMEELVLDKDAAKGLEGFSYYEIMEFGYLLRERLIEKWLSIGRDHTLEREQLMHEVYRAERLVDTILGKNLVPAHPIFILVLLQQVEAHTAVDTRSGAYGYFYDVMITVALNKTSSSPDDVDAKYTYLAELAWHLFQKKTRELDSEEFDSFNSKHWNKYRLTADSATFQTEMKRARMLLTLDGGVRFNYRYLYYYFVARYMRDNLSDPAVQAGVDHIVQNLHREDCANVIIFLTYLSKDRGVISKVLDAAKTLYADIPPCDLDSHVEFLNRLQVRVPEILIPEGDADTRRREVLRTKDQMAEAETPESVEPEGQTDEEKKQIQDMLLLNRALKSLQIMGQILRNFSGSLPGDLKSDLAKECFSIGLRSLNMIYRVFEANLEGTLTGLAELLGKRLDKGLNSEREHVARHFLFFVTEMLCFGMMRRISAAVGSERLIPTYEDVRRIYDNRATDFIQMLIRLDHCKAFPEKKVKELHEDSRDHVFAQTLLRVMVADHFYMFHRPHQVRQHVCAMLGMKHTPKMLAAGSTRKRRS